MANETFCIRLEDLFTGDQVYYEQLKKIANEIQNVTGTTVDLNNHLIKSTNSDGSTHYLVVTTDEAHLNQLIQKNIISESAIVEPEEVYQGKVEKVVYTSEHTCLLS
jgi:F0F1-type ATP synthase gamma subunit